MNKNLKSVMIVFFKGIQPQLLFWFTSTYKKIICYRS